MPKVNILGLFCEDIREEQRGLISLIGIFQDNVNVETESGTAPKLCIYVRTSFDVSDPAPPGALSLTFPDGEIVEIGLIEQNVIDTAVKNSIEQKNPTATLVSRAILVGLKVTVGRFVVTANLGGETYRVASLSFNLSPAAIGSTSSTT